MFPNERQGRRYSVECWRLPQSGLARARVRPPRSVPARPRFLDVIPHYGGGNLFFNEDSVPNSTKHREPNQARGVNPGKSKRNGASGLEGSSHIPNER